MARSPAPAVPTGPLTMELAIRLSDGSFETKVIVPLDATAAQRAAAIERWLALAGQAVALGVENMTATLPRGEG